MSRTEKSFIKGHFNNVSDLPVILVNTMKSMQHVFFGEKTVLASFFDLNGKILPCFKGKQEKFSEKNLWIRNS